MKPILDAALFVAAITSPLLAQTPAPCFESNFGTNLNLNDDDVSPGNVLGFTFPGPGNIPVTAIDISSNGFVWLGSNTNSACCSGNINDFLTQMPRIAPLWMDLYPPAPGAGVYFNTFPATATSLARAVVTWDQVPEFFNIGAFTFQLQLLSDGSFTFLYDGNVICQNHDVVVGCTEGIAAVANVIDFSTITPGTPHLSGNNPTVCEFQSQTFDLAGNSYEFIPNAAGGYIVVARPGCSLARTSSFGSGCQWPAVSYELFTTANQIDLSNFAIDFVGVPGSGYTASLTTGFFTPTSTPLAIGDDQVVGSFGLPFGFPIPSGATFDISISSNGFIWLEPFMANGNPRCCRGKPSNFVADPASIAALWQDLNPAAGGNVYFDVDPNGTEVHITWDAVPEYPNLGANTAQITLRSNGSFRLSYGNVANLTNDCLVGFSEGNGASDPGSRDFTALPFAMGGGGQPMLLARSGSTRPALGTTFVLELSLFPSSSTLGIMAFGFAQFPGGIDLTPLGMPGCKQHVSLDATAFFLLTSSPAQLPFPIPSDPGLIGVTINTQALTLSPGANALGALTSNGLEMRIGQ